MLTKQLKSAWQVAKELGPDSEISPNAIKVAIIRMGKAGRLSQYEYRKGSKTLTLYDEDEVKSLLGQGLREIRVLPDSIKVRGGGWRPRAEVIEDMKHSINVKQWVWEGKNFDTKEKADFYARFAAKQKINREFF